MTPQRTKSRSSRIHVAAAEIPSHPSDLVHHQDSMETPSGPASNIGTQPSNGDSNSINAPCLPYDVLSAARTQAIADLAQKPHSRRLQGAAKALTSLLLMLEVADAQSR